MNGVEKMIVTHQFTPAVTDYNDPELAALIQKETLRQELTINLIASENYVSHAVRAVMASTLTNKYAEGNAHKRYYEGCEVIDDVEDLAVKRLKELFGAEHANVQAHSGSQANQAAYHAILNPGDLIMGMKLDHGGHLTHGHPINFSGIAYKSIQYGVDPITEQFDYDAIEKLALEHHPKVIVVGASAYSRTIDFARFASIAKKVGAYLIADIAHITGLIIAGAHPSPVGHADIITGTTHKTFRGPRGGFILSTKELAEKIDKAIMPGIQGGPFMHAIAAKAAAFHEALQPSFTTYQYQIITNAQTLAQALIKKSYRIVSGGTDNHLMVIDLTAQNINGSKAAKALAKAGITVSKSTIPNDPTKPWITSGVRLGTPALTTRGMKEAEMEKIAEWFDLIIKHHDDEQLLATIKADVERLCKQFPLP